MSGKTGDPAEVGRIESAIVHYVTENHPSEFDAETLPRDKSLIELGILDSYGIVELVSFLEEEWKFTIADDDITTDNFGSIAKIAGFVAAKGVS
jgi:acyl carrier protein